MKTFLKVFFTFLASIAFVNHVSASDFVIEKLGKNAFTLQLNNSLGDEVKISIEDKKGYRVHSIEVIREISISKKYNLDKLPTGKYKLKIERNKSILIQPFNIKNEELAIDKEDKSIIYKPEINYLRGNMYVDFFQLKKRNTTIQLFDEAGNTLMKEIFKVEGNVQRKYNTAKLSRGSYTVYVKIDEVVYTEKIAVR